MLKVVSGRSARRPKARAPQMCPFAQLCLPSQRLREPSGVPTCAAVGWPLRPMVRAAHSEDCFWPWGPGNCTFTQIRFSVVVWVHLEFHSHDTNAPCKLHPLASNRGTPVGQRCQLHTPPPPAWQTSTLCLGPDAPQRAVPAYVQLPRPPAVGVRPRRPGPGPRHKVLSSGDPSPWKTPPSHLLCVVPVT